MSDVRDDTIAVLDRIAERLAAAAIPGDPSERMHQLAREVQQPCVVAIVGRVNAGKSTFVNALLGAAKAVVGTTETTATINYFVYGDPEPQRPVRCRWRNGRITDEDEEFLASLQGNDDETLRRAEGIEALEYLMPLPWLQTVSVVDTPGVGATVEAHEQRSREFLRVRDELSRRREAESQRLQSTADAIIYLVGPVALTSDRELLDQFREATGAASSALNALGVLAKTDLDDNLLARRHELAAKIAGQLEHDLNTVIPVSAGLAAAGQELADTAPEWLQRLHTLLRPLNTDTVETLLADEALFCEIDLTDCPLPPAERLALRHAKSWPWSVFATVARIAAEADLSDADVIDRVVALSGFDDLRATLGRHFLDRAEIIRCFRVVRDANAIVQSLRFEYLPRLRRETTASRERLQRFRAFVEDAAGDAAIRAQLLDWLDAQFLPYERIDDVETLWHDLNDDLSMLLHRLTEHNADFEALQCLEANIDDFSEAEITELRSLFGMYGAEARQRLSSAELDVRSCARRQLVWRHVYAQTPPRTPRARVAGQAQARLGYLMDELMSHPEPSEAPTPLARSRP